MPVQETTRLQKRIVLFAMLGILATGLVVGFSTALPFYQHARAHSEESVTFNVRGQAQAIGHYLGKLGDVVMQFTSRSQIRNRLEQYNSGEITLAAAADYSVPRLQDAMSQTSDVVGLTRLAQKGEVIARIGVGAPERYWPRLPAGANSAVIRGPVAIDGTPYLIVAAPILNRNGERVGTDIAVAGIGALKPLLNNYRTYGVAASQYLANLSQNSELSIDVGTGQWRLQNLQPEVAEAVSRAVSQGSGILRGVGQRHDEVMFYAPIPQVDGWGLTVMTDAGDLYAPALSEMTLPLLTILVMVLAGVAVTSRAIRPLAQEVVAASGRLSMLTGEQQSLLELAQGFVLRLDSEGLVIDVSPAAEDVIGYAPQEMMRPFRELLTDSPINENAIRAVDEVLRTASQFNRPFLAEVRHLDGRPVMLELLIQPQFVNRRFVGVSGVARDVTSRIRTENALRENEQRLRTLINATPDIICFKDGEGRWLEANDADLELFQLTDVDYRGKTDRELADHTASLYREAFIGCELSDELAWRAGGPSRGEEVIPSVDGKIHVYDVIKVPVFGDGGKRRGLVVLGRDITEKRQVEEALLKSAQEWSYAMDFFEDGVLLLNLDSRVVSSNRAFYRMTGLSADQVVGQEIASIAHPCNDGTACPVCATRDRRQDAFFTLEARDTNNPTHRPVEVMVKMIRNEEDTVVGILMGFHDLTRARHAEEEMRLAASVFEGSQEAIMIMDPGHRVIDVNQAFSTATGYEVSAVVGRELCDFLTEEQFHSVAHDQVWMLVDQEGSWQGEVWYRRKDGEVFPAWQSMSAVKDSAGRVVRYIGVFNDISEKKASEERIYRLAHYDLLTDLPNRVLLHDRLQNALDRMRRAEQKVAILFLDLDRFKNVNDSLGHPVGDRLLQVVAHRLTGTVREQDTVSRLGGDEFLVILEGLEKPQYAGVVARKMLEALREPIRVEQHELYIGASIGISLFPDDGDNAETLIKNADTAMYRAKEKGRDNYQFYTPELTLLSLERFGLESGLRRAIERDELVLYYQPQVSYAGDKLAGVEALVRWMHPEKGLIPPDKFIPLAEESGLINAIGLWVLHHSCLQAKAWADAGCPIRVAVNLSGKQIVDDALVATVREVLDETGLEPSLLELEITEGFVLSHADTGIRTLGQLKALGIELAIDDFGTGYSSLSYLKKLPIDRLKIDRSFVQGLPEDRDDVSIVTTIIAMARNLGLGVIAEGVETEAQREFLRAGSCDEYQGFLISRPLPVVELEQLLEEKQLK